MKTLSVTVLGIVLFLSACFEDKPPADLSRLRVGMTKQQVIGALGPPDKVAVDGRVQYLQYDAYENSGWDWKGRRNFRWLFVRIVDGQVETFGEKGDFDSTKDPTVHVKIDQRIDQRTTPSKADSDDSDPDSDSDSDSTKRHAPTRASPAENTPDKFDLATELRHLDRMKKDGLLTDAEYTDLRKSAIDKAKAR